MTDTLFFADENDRSVSSFAEFVALLGVTPSGAATFLAKSEGNLESSWRLWQENWFSPVLGPAFCRIYQLASTQSVTEIVEEDLALSKILSATLAQRSIDAALPFREGKSEMKAHREWQRFSDAVDGDRAPGHITTLFALQAALYHLPLSPSLTAYAKLEFICGINELPNAEKIRNEAIFQTIIPHVAVAVNGNCYEDNEGSPFLRAL